MRISREQLREIVFVIFVTIVILALAHVLSGCLSANKQQAAYTNSEIAIEATRRNTEWLRSISGRLDVVESHKHDVPVSESIPWWGWLVGGGTIAGGGAGLIARKRR